MGIRRRPNTANTRVGAAVCVAAAVLLLTACAPRTGDDLAAGAADFVAEQIADRMEPYASRDREADWLAATFVPGPADPPVTVRAGAAPIEVRTDALGWEGTTRGDGTAVVEFRVDVDAEAYSPGTFGARGYDAGSATRCYRITVTGQRGSEEAALEGISCEDRVAPPRPTPTEPPALADAEEAALLELVGSAEPSAGGAAALATRLEARFDPDAYRSETDFAERRLIVAVGLVDSPTDCIVVVRQVDGAPERVGGFTPEWLMPGETGCSTRLVTNPPR